MHPIQEALEAGFKHGPVMLVVDTRVAGVSVPSKLKGAPNLKVKFSPRYAYHDLVMDETKLQQTLSFDGKDHAVVVPWEAVLAIKDERGHLNILFDQLPTELLERCALAVFHPIEYKPTEPAEVAPKKPSLRVVSE